MQIGNKIINNILADEKVIRYKELEKIVNSNKKLKKLLRDLKLIQKQIVHARALSKNNALKELEKNYDIKMNEIVEYPLLSEYLMLQTEINQFLSDFTNIVEKGIMKDLTTK